ncbi:MAG: aldehyde ferredoxin oxidoreductase family protein [Eubacteriales bacterium]
MFGYAGRILRVNLNDRRTSFEELPGNIIRDYFGGKGFGTLLLYRELAAGSDPLGPDNKLIFCTGPLAGTNIPGSSRYTVMAKSPLTSFLGEAHAGGYFGRHLKWVGLDAIVVEGSSEKPVYLLVSSEGVEIRSAEHIWGRDTGDAENILRDEIGDRKARVACIGKAGENLVRYACIMSDKIHAAGRTGLGAVMGSKKLKAVVLSTKNQTIQLADPEKVTGLVREIIQLLNQSPYTLSRRKFGSPGSVKPLNIMGVMPAYNFRDGTFTGADKIFGEAYNEQLLKGRLSCPGCPSGCGRIVEVTKGPYAPVNPEYGGPHYETVVGFGPLVGNSDLEMIAKANELCNRYGLDTISTSVTIAFAIECFEEGIISASQTGGKELRWGNGREIIELIGEIAERKGFGQLLAEGSGRCAELFGGKAWRFLLTVKDLELPMHDGRGKKGVALSYATSNRGGCHLRSPHDEMFVTENKLPEFGLADRVDRLAMEGKAKFVKNGQDFHEFLDMLPLCKWASPPRTLWDLRRLLDLLTAVTGEVYSASELAMLGDRVYNLGRLWNIREGLTSADDRLPLRFSEPLREGGSKGSFISEESLVNELSNYYEYRGWNRETGVPLRMTFERLGLQWAIDGLQSVIKRSIG